MVWAAFGTLGVGKQSDSQQQLLTAFCKRKVAHRTEQPEDFFIQWLPNSALDFYQPRQYQSRILIGVRLRVKN